MELNMGIDKRLCITVPEAAEMLGISRNFAYELVKQGQLPVIRFGKRLLIPRVALQKRLEESVTQCNSIFMKGEKG
jgi:excisionase family DNA binding protein